MIKKEIQDKINKESLLNYKEGDKSIILMDDYMLYEVKITAQKNDIVMITKDGVDTFGEDIFKLNTILKIESIKIDEKEATVFYELISPLNNKSYFLYQNEFKLI